MEQPRSLRQQTYQIATEYLIQNFFNIGKPTNEKNETNSEWAKTTPSRFDHIRNSFIVLSLRKNLSISSKTVSKGGKPLVYHNHGNTVNAKPVQNFFTNMWPNGFISNFKRIGKKFRPLPNVVVVIVNDNTKRFAIETELLRTKINSFFVTNTNNAYTGLYNIFGNNDSPRSANLLNDLLVRSLSVGFLQETSRVKVKRRFPRLGSNQRPRT